MTTAKLARCRCAEDSYRGPATSDKPHTDPATCPAYDPPPPLDPDTLDREELVLIVRRVQRILWADAFGRWDDPAMDRYTEWSSDTPEGIAEALNASGLAPWSDPYVTRGTDPETCAECAAPMYGRVRIHHHSENGRDVTRATA